MSINNPESGQKPGAKDLFNLIKKSPALLVTGIVGVIVVGFILIRNSQQNTASSQPSAADITSPGGYSSEPGSNAPVTPIVPIIIQPIAPAPTTPGPAAPTPTPTPTPTTPTPSTPVATVPSTSQQEDIIRTRYGNPSVTGYDKTHTGVPIRSGPNTGNTIAYAPYGSKITITGPAVAGSSNLGSGDTRGTTYWYPVAGGGYVSAFDVQSSFPAASTTATVPSNS